MDRPHLHERLSSAARSRQRGGGAHEWRHPAQEPGSRGAAATRCLLTTTKIRVHLLQPPNAILRVEFRSHGRDKALAHWSDSLRRKLWETKAKPVQEFSAANAGIGGNA